TSQCFVYNLLWCKGFAENLRGYLSDFFTLRSGCSNGDHRRRCSDTNDRLHTARAYAPDEHSNIRTLSAAVCMKFVKNQKAKVLIYAVPNRPLSHAGQEQL